MQILHLNTLDSFGGAARAMSRLHHGLQRAGHQSHILAGYCSAAGPGVGALATEVAPFIRPGDRIIDFVGRGLERLYALDTWSYRASWRLVQTSAFRRADIVHMHNLHSGYFNVRALSELAKHKPLVWTLHDMWALTGHCAYSYDCERWRTGCHHCPLLREPGRQLVEPAPLPVDRTRALWQEKRQVYRSARLQVVTPSAWLRDLAEESILASDVSVRCIPYGVDLELFRPVDQTMARQALDLPVDKQVILFSAAGVTNERKGYAYLARALEQLPDPGSLCLLISGGQIDLGTLAERFGVRQVGYLGDERLQALAFAAADIVVCPTLADNQPLVLLEALACGTPAVAFATGGVSQVVRHLETGYLARYRDAEDLARGIQTLLSDEPRLAWMRKRCRALAEAEYSLERYVRGYLDLYSEVLAREIANEKQTSGRTSTSCTSTIRPDGG